MAELTATSSPSSVGEAPYRARQLVVVYGPGKERPPILQLERGSVVIGRDPEAELSLRLDDSEVSRNHASIELEGDVWWVADLGSRNGTIVDGVKVERAPLRHGAVIRTGRTLLLYLEIEIQAGEVLRPERPGLRGNSIAMQRVRGEISMVAPRGAAVLVLGETGVGKECVARELHEQSGRKGPLVPVNCAAISENLAESELFGHAAGAFTGATAKSEGMFAAAHGGTLFLDEVGELPLAVQPKLLRALWGGEVRAVGRAEPQKVDARIIAATHRDLAAAVEAGGFRADLFARLSGWTVRVPPLRERREDVLWLARGFLERDDGQVRLSAGAAEALLLYQWPYNVRELEQVLAAAAVRAQGGVLRAEHLPAEIGEPVRARRSPARAGRAPLEAVVPRDRVPGAADLRRALEHFGGNVGRTAEYFGKDRQQVYRWMKRHGIDVDDLRKGEGDGDDEPGG